MPRILTEITADALPLSPPMQWLEIVADPDNGAAAWFYGVTRRTTGQEITRSLHYEAHPTMARKQLESIAMRAGDTFGLSGVVIVHRVGDVDVGQASIAVGCGSPHRKECFAALAWMMDRIKADVPIWKRDDGVTGDGKPRRDWVHPNAGPKR